MIWFKLESISEPIENANEFIRDYTYLCIDEHFVSENSPFSVFNNKRVFNLREMLEQQCTIWYLRNAEESDTSQQIVSYAPGSGPFDGVFPLHEIIKYCGYLTFILVSHITHLRTRLAAAILFLID